MTKHIMIVDDSPEILTLYRVIFKRSGYTVIAAEDGVTALEMLADSKPDLFILDVMMPEVNGIEMCKKLRAMPEHKHTPIIVLSAYSDSGIIEQAFAAGANDYVLKPINHQEMEEKVAALMAANE